MGYDMFSAEGGEYFRANISGMQMLRSVMEQCGVRGGAVSQRILQEREDYDDNDDRPADDLRQATLEGDLYSCFSSNDGWLVTPNEARYIAERLREGLEGIATYEYLAATRSSSNMIIAEDVLTEEDLKFAREFAEFNVKCAELGGYYVW